MLEDPAVTIQKAIATLRQLVQLEIEHSVFVGFRGLYPTYKIGDRTIALSPDYFL
jgi:hypothetical protein